MLDRLLIQSAFQNKEYSVFDYITKIETFKLLTDLNEQEFDKQTFEEMWDQCKMNSKGQIKLQSLMQTFIKAQLILTQRDKDIQISIERLKQKKVDLREQQNNIQIQQINEQIEEILQEKAANLINLQIIRKPFRTFYKNNPNYIKKSKQGSNIIQKEQQKFQIKNILISNTHTYSWIFQLTFILLIVQIPIILYYSVFVNTFLFLFILFSLISQYFCRIILRIELFMTLFTLLLDLVWYCVQVKSLWNLNQHHDWPFFISPYLKIAVILFSVTFIGKIILSLLLISEYNTDESQNKKVSFLGIWKIQLSHQNHEKNIFGSLTVNHNIQEKQEIVNK